MQVKITDRDHGYKAFLAKMAEASKERGITVGIHAAEGSAPVPGGKGTTLVEVGTWNEFGTDSIPSRSFIREWFDEYLPLNTDAKRKLMRQVVEGRRDVPWVLRTLGVLFVGQIQQRIAQGIDPANAESTIARKGSDTPLINTGQLRSGITYEVAS